MASLTGFEVDHLLLVNDGSDDRLPVEQIQPTTNRSHSLRVDDACLERTACNSDRKPTASHNNVAI